MRFPTGERLRGFFQRYGIDSAKVRIRDARDVRPTGAVPELAAPYAATKVTPERGETIYQAMARRARDFV